MTRFTLNPRAIVALANIRGDDDRRPALQGIHLAPDGTMTATDGKVLLTWRNAAQYDGDALAVVAPEIAAAFSMNGLPNTITTNGYVLEITPAVVKLAKRFKKDTLHFAALEISGTVATWITARETALARVLDDTFPAVANVIPATVPEVAPPMPPISAELLARFATVSPTHTVTLTPTGERGAVCLTFQDEPDAFGLLMPMRDDGASHVIPEWVHPQPEAAALAA